MKREINTSSLACYIKQSQHKQAAYSTQIKTKMWNKSAICTFHICVPELEWWGTGKQEFKSKLDEIIYSSGKNNSGISSTKELKVLEMLLF